MPPKGGRQPIPGRARAWRSVYRRHGRDSPTSSAPPFVEGSRVRTNPAAEPGSPRKAVRPRLDLTSHQGFPLARVPPDLWSDEIAVWSTNDPVALPSGFRFIDTPSVLASDDEYVNESTTVAPFFNETVS